MHFQCWFCCLWIALCANAVTLYDELVSRIGGVPAISAKRCLAESATRDLQDLLARVERYDAQCPAKLAKFYCKRMARAASPEFQTPFPSQCRTDVLEPLLQGLPNQSRIVSGTASSMPLAFFFLVNRNVPIAWRALLRLYDSINSFAVHVDPRQPEAFEEIKGLVASKGWTRIDIFSEIAVHRGGPSMIRAEVLGLQRLLARSERWDYFLYLSDSDYPLATAQDMNIFLRLHSPISFTPVVYAFGPEEHQLRGRQLVVGRPDLPLRAMPSRRLVYECGGHAFAIQPELDYPLRQQMLYGTGSFSVALERGFASWLAAELEVKGSLVHSIFQEEATLGQPDETFFQAVLLNSPYCNRHLHSSLHYSWVDQQSRPSYALNDSDVSSLSPVVLTDSSFKHIVLGLLNGSEWSKESNKGIALHPSFFARKLQMPQSNQILEAIDAHLNESMQWYPVRSENRGNALAKLGERWLQSTQRNAGGKGASIKVVKERRGPLSLPGLLTVGFEVRTTATAPSWLEMSERLALPAMGPAHPRQLKGRVLALRVASLEKGQAVAASILPAGAHHVVVEAVLSPVEATCEMRIDWVDPKGVIRAAIEMHLVPWQQELHSLYPKRRGPSKHGEWRVVVSPVNPETCGYELQQPAERTFFVYSSNPAKIPLAELKKYWDFNLRSKA